MNQLRQNTLKVELALMALPLADDAIQYDAIASNAKAHRNYKPDYPISTYKECMEEQAQSWACDFHSVKKVLGLKASTPAFIWSNVCGGESHVIECPEHEHSCVRNGCGKSWNDSSFTEQGVNVLTTQGWLCIDYRSSSERSTMPF